MIKRALPPVAAIAAALLFAGTSLAQSAADTPAGTMAAAIATGWTARGVAFTPAEVAARIAGRSGDAALLALAGATANAEGEEVETMVEIVWQSGRPGPAFPLLLRDLAAGLPGVLQDQAGHWWLVTGHVGGRFSVRHPLTKETRVLPASDVQRAGRPLIAGA